MDSQDGLSKEAEIHQILNTNQKKIEQATSHRLLELKYWKMNGTFLLSP